MRVLAMLARDQTISFSVPRNLGEPAIEGAFTRRGNRVLTMRSDTIAN